MQKSVSEQTLRKTEFLQTDFVFEHAIQVSFRRVSRKALSCLQNDAAICHIKLGNVYLAFIRVENKTASFLGAVIFIWTFLSLNISVRTNWQAGLDRECAPSLRSQDWLCLRTAVD